MTTELKIVGAPGRVLSTLNEDGSRRWLRPRSSRGRFHLRRRVTAYGLMLAFFLIPYFKLNGKPLIQLDLLHWEFSFFGTTFLPNDTLPFMLLFVSSVIAIFLATALLGRVWCGWACPQTVYLEYLFRPIEYLIEGGPRGTRKLDRKRGLPVRRLLKYGVFTVLALFLAHTFLAYFVGVEQLAQWVRRSPVEHPTSFFVMAGTTALIFFDFAYFREQTCLVACPYGRLQSVLLDRRSLIVGYDPGRGEPRMKGMPRPAGAGDCVDCQLCVITCPTGIDIREGLQMECIHCTQCIDACDAVMERIGRPPGLIRYTSRNELEGKPAGMLRPRAVIYLAALSITGGLLIWSLNTRSTTEVTLLRGIGAPYTVEQGGDVANQVRIKIANRGPRDAEYRIAIEDVPAARLVAPMNPLRVPARQSATTSIFVMLKAADFDDGARSMRLRLDDGRGFTRDYPWSLLGPKDGDEERGEGERHEGGGPREESSGGHR